MISMPINAYSWTFDYDFDNEVTDRRTSSFSDAANGSIVSNDVSFSGEKSVKLNVNQGTDGFGYFGGRKHFPQDLSEGDEIWIRLRTMVPTDFDYSTNFALKFLRLHVKTSVGEHIGYSDIYINGDGSFMYQNELYTTVKLKTQNQIGTFNVGEVVRGQNSGARATIKAIKSNALVYERIGSTTFSRWEPLIGETTGASATLNQSETNSVSTFGASGSFAKGVWKTFIYRVRFSATRPLVQFYASVGNSYNLMFEDTTDFTLRSSTDLVDGFLLFTYWNGLAPRTQHLYIDDLYISTEPPAEIGTRPKKADQNPAL